MLVRMSASGFAACVFALALFAAPVDALAVEPPSPMPLDPKAAADETRAGLARYKAGDYERAAVHFLRAYELSRRPAQLRNTAKALEVAGREADALARWRQYVLLDGISTERRNGAVDRIAILSARLQLRQTPPEQVTTVAPDIGERAPVLTQPRHLSGSDPSTVASWTLAGVGAASLVAGGILLWSGWNTHALLERTAATGQEVSYADARAAEARAAGGVGLGAAGLGLVLTGVLVGIFVGEPTGGTASVSVGDGAVMVGYATRLP